MVSVRNRGYHAWLRLLLFLPCIVLWLTVYSPDAGIKNPEPIGWYAGDMHVHRSCGGAPEPVADIYKKMIPQDLAVVSLLADMGNGEVQNADEDLPRVTGKDAPISRPGRILHWDGEWHWDTTYTQYPHRALGGHIGGLGLSEALQIWEEYTFPVFQWIHRHDGIGGFFHMEYLDYGIPQTLNCCGPLEYPVEVALGSCDFIEEDVADCGYQGTELHPDSLIQAYYRLLNCGFRPGLAAGTDYPCNGKGALGDMLTYVRVSGRQLTYRGWIEGIARGRTVISRNGHNEFLDLRVNGSATPGDEVKLAGRGNVEVRVVWTAKQNIDGLLELVCNGAVVARKRAYVKPGAPVIFNARVDFARSGWLAARRMGANGHQVHTAAVFVTVNNAPVRASVADAEFYVEWMDNLLEKTSPGGAWSSYLVKSRAAARERYRAAREVYRQIAVDAGRARAVPSVIAGRARARK